MAQRSQDAVVPAGAMTGLASCPEPVNFDIIGFLSCVKQTCMSTLVVPSFLLPPKPTAVAPLVPPMPPMFGDIQPVI